MSSEWNQVKLGDLVNIKHGFAFKGEFFSDKPTSYQLTTPGNFAIGGGFQPGKGKFYSGPVPEDYVLKTGDLLVTMTDLSKAADTLGYAAVVPDSVGTTWLHNQRVGLISVKPNTLLNKGFLHYLMRSPAYRRWVVSTATGSTVKHTSPGRICEFEFNLPPIEYQDYVAEMLGALDDRIALLRETNTTHEAIAQALFKSWFVDFDPVHAKMQGRVPEGMDEATAALFPDSFEDSELGPVPKGWVISSVADVAEIVKGKSYSSKDLADRHTTALVTLKSFERGGGFRMDGFKPYLGSFKPTQVVIPGDLIVAYTDVTQAAELIGKPAIVVGVEEHDTLIASLDVGIVRPDFSVIGRQFLYGLFKTDAFQNHTLAHTSGTTVLHLAKDGVGSYQFARPSVGLINVFEGIATELAERRQINNDQLRTLTSLRDTLLPRLISGQLSIEHVRSGIHHEYSN